MHFSVVPLRKGQVQELIHRDGVHWVGPAYTTKLELFGWWGGGGGGMFYHDSGCSELRQCAVLQKGLNSPVCGWARLMQVLLRLVEGSGSTPVGVC